MCYRTRANSYLAVIASCALALVGCKGDDSPARADARTAKKDMGVVKLCTTSPCTKDSDCPDKLPVCRKSDGTCVECLTDAHCASVSGRPYCQKRTRTCVSCRTDSDCTTGLKKCHTFAGTCKQCESDEDCVSPTARCERSSYICMRCDKDADCERLDLPPGFPTGQKWKRCVKVSEAIRIKVCMQCRTSRDCAKQHFRACKRDIWGAMTCIGCTTDAQCCEAGGDCGLRCNVPTGKCQCDTDAQCQAANKAKGGVWKCRERE